MAPFSREVFADEPASDGAEAALRAICARAGHLLGTVVDARPVAEELGIVPKELFALILTLTEYGFLEYEGAGPRVRVTALGASRCHQMTPPPETG